MKLSIALAFAAILAALAAAGIAMLRSGRETREHRPKSKAMMHALAWRVGLSVTLFIALLLSYFFGWIEPTGIALR